MWIAIPVKKQLLPLVNSMMAGYRPPLLYIEISIDSICARSFTAELQTS
jgi:hypothetical protein